MTTDRKSLLALRGVGPESEAESVRFDRRRVTKVGPEVKRGLSQVAARNSQSPMRDKVFPSAKAHCEFLVDSKHGGCQKIAFPVKQTPLLINLVRIIALWLSIFAPTARAQPSDEKPNKAFWPREVEISEDIKFEQETKYGLVTAKRIAGSVVKVNSLESDSLRIESDGFLGTVDVEKTDFWDRAERTRSAAIERTNREQALVKEREEREFEKKMRAARLQWYEAAPVLQFEIIQVLNDGCLAMVLNENHKRIFIEQRGANLAQGQRYEVRAEQSGTFKYMTGTGCTGNG